MNYYPYYQPLLTGQNQAVNQGIIWVSGEAGAKSYLVAPNSTVVLWDSEAKTIYVKSADASGMPSMKVIDYTERVNEPANGDSVTRKDIESINERIEKLKSQIEAITEVKHEPFTNNADVDKSTK